VCLIGYLKRHIYVYLFISIWKTVHSKIISHYDYLNMHMLTAFALHAE